MQLWDSMLNRSMSMNAKRTFGHSAAKCCSDVATDVALTREESDLVICIAGFPLLCVQLFALLIWATTMDAARGAWIISLPTVFSHSCCQISWIMQASPTLNVVIHVYVKIKKKWGMRWIPEHSICTLNTILMSSSRYNGQTPGNWK